MFPRIYAESVYERDDLVIRNPAGNIQEPILASNHNHRHNLAFGGRRGASPGNGVADQIKLQPLRRAPALDELEHEVILGIAGAHHPPDRSSVQAGREIYAIVLEAHRLVVSTKPLTRASPSSVGANADEGTQVVVPSWKLSCQVNASRWRRGWIAAAAAFSMAGRIEEEWETIAASATAAVIQRIFRCTTGARSSDSTASMARSNLRPILRENTRRLESPMGGAAKAFAFWEEDSPGFVRSSGGSSLLGINSSPNSGWTKAISWYSGVSGAPPRSCSRFGAGSTAAHGSISCDAEQA